MFATIQKLAMWLLSTMLDGVVEMKLRVQDWYNRRTAKTGYHWLGFNIYHVDDEGDHHMHPENDQLRRMHQVDGSTYKSGPFHYASKQPKQADDINQILQWSDIDYYISVAYTYNNEEYRIVYKNRVTFPPYPEEVIDDFKSKKMQRKVLQAFCKSYKNDKEQFWDVTDQIRKYAGPMGNFYVDLAMKRENVPPVSLKTSSIHQTLLQRGEDFDCIIIKDNRGKDVKLGFNTAFRLPPLSRPSSVSQSDPDTFL